MKRQQFILSDRLLKFFQTDLFVLLVYLILPYLFFAVGVNIFQTAIAPGDGIVQGVPTKIMTSNFLQWDPFIQGGTFSFKDIGMQALYFPGIIVMRLFPNPFGYNFLLLAHYSLAGFFTFLFLREQKLNNIASRLGGMVFMFCGFLVAHKGHHTMMMASAYLPIVLYFIERYFTTTKIQNLFLGAFAFSLSILADYIAVPMYIGMVSFPYIIFRSLSEFAITPQNLPKMNRKIVLSSFIIYIGGLLLASIEVFPIIESVPYVTRQNISYSFFASYSFPIKQLPMLIFPYIFGTQSPSPLSYQNYYYGQWNLTEMAGYMGILPIMFATLAVLFFGKRNRNIYFWVVIFFFSFILVLGDSTPFYQLMYKVPIYNMFRASARNWLEVNFSVAVLSSYFIHNVITDNWLQKRRYFNTITWLAIIFGTIIVFILVFAKDLAQSVEKRQIWIENTRLDSSAIYIPIIIILISIMLLYFLYQFKGNKGYWIIIGVVLFLDLFSFGHYHDTGYATYGIFQDKQNETASFLNNTENDKNQYRILTLNMGGESQLNPNINMMYGFNTINGYSPIWLQDYKNLTTFEANGVSPQKYKLLYNSSILSILSAKYIITSDQNDKNYLESILAGNSPTLSRRIILTEGFTNKRWNLFSPDSIKNNSIILKSKELNLVSLIQIPFEVAPKSHYLISFEVRLPKEILTVDPLIIDFIGDNYDNSAQEAYIEASLLSGRFQEFSADFYSGETSPSIANLRFFTYSKIPYEIRDVSMVEINDSLPYFNNNQNLEGFISLYNKKHETPEGIAVYENMNFLPRARFVKEIEVVENTASAVDKLWNDRNLNPYTTALVEGYFFEKTIFNTNEVIGADFSNNNHVSLLVKTSDSGFLVLSDTWYPGWVATVDGKETQIYKTNAVSRGILIEGTGEHLVEFKFVPMSFYIGLLVSGATILVMVIYLLIAYRKQSKSVLQ